MGKLAYPVRLRVLQSNGTELGTLNLTGVLSLVLALVELGVVQSKLQEDGHLATMTLQQMLPTGSYNFPSQLIIL